MFVTLSRNVAPALRRTRLAVVSSRYFTATPFAPDERISFIIRRDHRDLEEAYYNIVDAPTIEDKVKWRNLFTWELVRHGISEEMLIYPLMEKLFWHGDLLADRDREEHQTIKNYLKDFQNMSPEDENFAPTLDALWKNLKPHMEQEEQKDLVAIEEHMTAYDSEQLGRMFERTKMLTPTRSHPKAPIRPPFDTAIGLMAAPLDRIKDLFRKFPDNNAGRHPPP